MELNLAAISSKYHHQRSPGAALWWDKFVPLQRKYPTTQRIQLCKVFSGLSMRKFEEVIFEFSGKKHWEFTEAEACVAASSLLLVPKEAGLKLTLVYLHAQLSATVQEHLTLYEQGCWSDRCPVHAPYSSHAPLPVPFISPMGRSSRWLGASSLSPRGIPKTRKS